MRSPFQLTRPLAAFAVGLAVVLGAGAGEPAEELGVMTGSEKGTYYQFGLNLQRLVKQAGIDLSVHTSKGSIENIYAVHQRPATHMGIVQSDVLAFVSRMPSDPVLKQVAEKTKVVFPLYNEEVHLLARREVVDFDDLEDRKVAIGREGSGTYLTARLLFKVSEVSPRQMLQIDTERALAELKAGRIDAMFYVAGYPVKLFAEGVSAGDGLKLVPITHKSVTEFYPAAEIPAGTYAASPDPVRTVAVRAVLVSYDFRKRDCELVGRFAQTVSSNLAWLAQNGHPKWRSVDLDTPIRGWAQYDCVSRAIAQRGRAATPPGKTSSASNPVADAVKALMDD